MHQNSESASSPRPALSFRPALSRLLAVNQCIRTALPPRLIGIDSAHSWPKPGAAFRVAFRNAFPIPPSIGEAAQIFPLQTATKSSQWALRNALPIPHLVGEADQNSQMQTGTK